MLRLSALLVAAGLSIVAVGCAQCDTCDDFPAPCNGPNCPGAYGMGMQSQAGPVTYSAPSGAPGDGTEVLPPPSSPAGPGSTPPPPTSPGSGTIPAAPPLESKPAAGAPSRPGL
jgi:hypothetical protein